MSILKRRSAMVAASSAALVVAGMMVSPSAGAAGTASPTTSACYTRDGVSVSGGVFLGGVPARWEFGNSPYIGVRYDSCADVTRVYYGGYTGITHYNILVDPHITINGDRKTAQYEVGPGERRVATFTASNHAGPGVDFAVQACRRGGVFRTSTCTRWSPTVHLPG